MTKKFSTIAVLCLAILGWILLSNRSADSQQSSITTPVQQSATMLNAATNASHSHSTGATITITPPGNQYVYVAGIDLSDCAGGSAVTGAAPTFITTTNLTGSPQYEMGSAATAGLCTTTPAPMTGVPLKSTTPGTAVTFVLPSFATNQTISMNVYYYFAQ